MKKLILTFALTLIALCTNAQWWNEKTRDAAYEAPNSFLCKKWKTNKNSNTYLFSSNGTFKETVKIKIDDETKLEGTLESVGKYVRNKDVLSLTYLSAKVVPDPTIFAKLSARKRDEIQNSINLAQQKAEREKLKFSKLLLRLDEEYLIMAPYDPQSGGFNDYNQPVWYNETHEKKVMAARPSEDYETMEQKPEFPGGEEALMKFLSENICYPEEALKAGIQGRVVVSFIIEPDGSISNVQVVQGVNDSLNAEAVRVVSSMPKWTSGMMDGKAVRVKYNLPITFRK